MTKELLWMGRGLEMLYSPMIFIFFSPETGSTNEILEFLKVSEGVEGSYLDLSVVKSYRHFICRLYL